MQPKITPWAFVLAVPDLDRSAGYFRDVLGFRVLWEDATDWRLVERDSVRVMLGHCPNDMQATDLGSHNWFGYLDAVNSRYPSLARDILAFDEQLQQKFGVKLAYVHTDVAWNSDWRGQLQQLAAGLRARGIKLGVICDGDAKAPSDQAWVNLALQHCREAAEDQLIAPTQFVIQTWSPLPSRMLPETQPGTLTYEGRQAIAMFR
jgi:catechol 2,3-dioxygenase-like lactoylglutathione lyase family enzyme